MSVEEQAYQWSHRHISGVASSICVLIRECTASNTCVRIRHEDACEVGVLIRQCNPRVASTILTLYPEYECTHSTAATSTSDCARRERQAFAKVSAHHSMRISTGFSYSTWSVRFASDSDAISRGYSYSTSSVRSARDSDSSTSRSTSLPSFTAPISLPRGSSQPHARTAQRTRFSV